MKHLLLSLIVALCMNSGASNSMIPNNDTPPDQTSIELRGRLDLNAGPNSIEASVGRDAICIHFYQNFGNVNISIYNGY